MFECKLQHIRPVVPAARVMDTNLLLLLWLAPCAFRGVRGRPAFEVMSMSRRWHRARWQARAVSPRTCPAFTYELIMDTWTVHFIYL